MAPTPVNKNKKGSLKSTQKGYTKTPFSTATRRSMSSVPGPSTSESTSATGKVQVPNISSEQRVRTSGASGGASVASHSSNRSKTSSHAVRTSRNTPAESVAQTGSTNRQGTDGNNKNPNPRAPTPSESGRSQGNRSSTSNQASSRSQNRSREGQDKQLVDGPRNRQGGESVSHGVNRQGSENGSRHSSNCSRNPNNPGGAHNQSPIPPAIFVCPVGVRTEDEQYPRRNQNSQNPNQDTESIDGLRNRQSRQQSVDGPRNRQSVSHGVNRQSPVHSRAGSERSEHPPNS